MNPDIRRDAAQIIKVAVAGAVILFGLYHCGPTDPLMYDSSSSPVLLPASMPASDVPPSTFGAGRVVPGSLLAVQVEPGTPTLEAVAS